MKIRKLDTDIELQGREVSNQHLHHVHEVTITKSRRLEETGTWSQCFHFHLESGEVIRVTTFSRSPLE